MNNDRFHLTSLLPALAAIAGAAVGGYATYQATNAAQHEETRRADVREERLALGAVRYLQIELRIAKVGAAANETAGREPSIDADMRIDIPAADMQRVLARLTADEYVDVSQGISAATLSQQVLATARDRGTLGKGGAGAMRAVEGAIDTAAEALSHHGGTQPR
jgi:hypothetical protein